MMKQGLALASAVFFWEPIAEILSLIFPFSGPILWIPALIPTCVVSFVGSVILIYEARTDSVRRYLVLPFCLDTLVVLATSLINFYIQRSFPEGAGGMLWAFALLMLAPCSAAVFFSIPTGGTIRSVSIYTVTIISAYSVLTTFFLSIGGYLPMLGLVYIYWLFGMPIIGLCFLARAFLREEVHSSHL